MLKKLLLFLALIPLATNPYQDAILAEEISKQEALLISLVQQTAHDTPKELLSGLVTVSTLIKKSFKKIKKHIHYYYKHPDQVNENKETLKKLQATISNRLYKKIMVLDLECKLYYQETQDMSTMQSFNKSFNQLLVLAEKKYAKQLAVIRGKNLHEMPEHLTYNEFIEMLESVELLFDTIIEELQKPFYIEKINAFN